jgi:hypothetical protein
MACEMWDGRRDQGRSGLCRGARRHCHRRAHVIDYEGRLACAAPTSAAETTDTADRVSTMANAKP